MANKTPYDKNDIYNNDTINIAIEHNNGDNIGTDASVSTYNNGDNDFIDNSLFTDLLSYSYISTGLKTARTAHSLSQVQVAKILKISISTYSHYECGYRIPDLVTLLKISKLYKVNISYFVFLLCMDCIGKDDIDANTVFQIFSYNQQYDKDESYVLETFRTLPAKYKDDVISFLNSAKKCKEWEPPVML
jgi:transcriptional regulator with XRE-family HTH domain